MSIRAIAERAGVSIHSCTEDFVHKGVRTSCRKFLVTGGSHEVKQALQIMTAAIDRFNCLWKGTEGLALYFEAPSPHTSQTTCY